jgi:hypothetical protein
MAQPQDITVEIGSTGGGDVVDRLRDIQQSAQRLNRPFAALGGSIKKSFSSMSSAVTANIGKIGVAAAALTLAAPASLIAGLEKAKTIAGEVADELDRIKTFSDGVSIKEAAEAGAIIYAGQLNGMPNAEAVQGMLVKMVEVAKGAAEQNDVMLGGLARLGFKPSDFFNYAANSSLVNLEDIKSGSEIMLAYMERIKNAPEGTNLNSVMTQLFGAADAMKTARLLSTDIDAVTASMEEYYRLTGYDQAQVNSALAYADSLTANAAAILGVKTAFTTDLFPALTQNNKLFQEFTVRNREIFEILGGVVADFASQYTPILIGIGDKLLAFITTDNGVSGTPIERFFERVSGLITTVGKGIEGLLVFMTSGDINSDFVAGVVNFLNDTKEKAIEFIEVMKLLATDLTETIIPAIDKAITVFSNLLDKLGVEGPGTKIAIGGGLLIFAGTLTSVIGLVGTVVSGIATLTGGIIAGSGAAAAAAGLLSSAAAPLAAIAVTGLAVKGTADVASGVDDIVRRAEELGKTNSEAFVAAYASAALKKLKEDNKIGTFFQDALGGVFGDTNAEFVAKFDVISKEGSSEEAIAGVMQAAKDYGWVVGDDGRVEIYAGFTVDGVKFDEAVNKDTQDAANAYFDKLDAVQVAVDPAFAALEVGIDAKVKMPSIDRIRSALQIDEIYGLDAIRLKVQETLSAVGLSVTALVDLKIGNLDGLRSQIEGALDNIIVNLTPDIAAFSFDAPQSGPQLQPVIINMPGAGEFAFHGTPDEIKRLGRAVTQSRRSTP